MLRHAVMSRPVLALASLIGIVATRGASAADVDFSRDVRPILEAKCFACHGPAKQQADLRLDQRTPALKGGESGPAIVPGHAADSPLYRRVAGLGPEKPMPAKGERLTPPQVELVRAWIDQGAAWPADEPHAAARPPGSGGLEGSKSD